MQRSVFVTVLLVSLLYQYEVLSERTGLNGDIEYCSAQESDCPDNLFTKSEQSGCFRAAIFEHMPTYDMDDCRISTNGNLDTFKVAAEHAAKKGAKIIVFPEDGIFEGHKKAIQPCLEEIPNPESLTDENNNPCTQDEYKNFPILRSLSCMAKSNGIYVVANYGTSEKCEPSGEDCPSGLLMLNTDVVFDSQGRFIKRYRKYNMFVEIFQRAPTLEQVYFDSPMGRFGIFTCFDMMFEKPALELVEKYNVDTVLFPTWWYDELPILSAKQFQDGWSATNKVNLLASNMLIPRKGSIGSGIYSALDYHYTTGHDNFCSKLLIANIPKTKTLNQTCDLSPSLETFCDYSKPESAHPYQYKNYSLDPTDNIFQLKRISDAQTICSNGFCCTIKYELDANTDENDLKKLVFIVKSGLRRSQFKWFEQVCAFATLKAPFNIDKVQETQYDMEPIVKFRSLSIRGKFDSKYVYPISAHNVSHLITRNGRKFNCDLIKYHNQDRKDKQYICGLGLVNEEAQPIDVYSFGMYGRVYGRDEIVA